MQINAHGVHAFLVLPDIDKLEFLTCARLLLLCVVRIGNERLAPLNPGRISKRLIILFSFVGYIENQNLPRITRIGIGG